MASTFRRRGKDGKPLARWSYRWTDADGARRSGTGGTDRAATRQIADKKENEAKLVRAGLLEARDLAAAEAGRAPIVEHVEAYRLHLLAKGGTARHAKHIASVVTRLFEAARIKRLPDAGQDTLQAALHRLHQRRSPRTANHALGGVKGLLRWCYTTGRLADPPRWLAAIRPYSERVGRKLVRRALTRPEIDQLLTATATAPDSYSYGPTRARHHRRVLTGPDRVILYRVALGTGFRADELLTMLGTNPTPSAPDQPQEHDMAQPIYRMPEGDEYLLAVSELSPTGLGWVHIASQVAVDDATRNRLALPTETVNLAAGNDAEDQRWERHPVLSGPQKRDTYTAA